jgi:hypothetical protein
MGNSLEFDSYLEIRAGLIQFSRFVRAIEQHAGRDVCLAVRPDYDLWITELEYQAAPGFVPPAHRPPGSHPGMLAAR